MQSKNDLESQSRQMQWPDREFDKCPARAGWPGSLGVAGRGSLISPGVARRATGVGNPRRPCIAWGATPGDPANPAHAAHALREGQSATLYQHCLRRESPVSAAGECLMLKKLPCVGGSRAAAAQAARGVQERRAGDGGQMGVFKGATFPLPNGVGAVHGP